MAAKILLVGSVMMDLILRCERAPEPSESVLGHDYRNAPGGKGSNAAVAAARSGAQVSAYASVGKDSNGEYLLDRWKDEAGERLMADAQAQATAFGVTGVSVSELPDADDGVA